MANVLEASMASSVDPDQTDLDPYCLPLYILTDDA